MSEEAQKTEVTEKTEPVDAKQETVELSEQDLGSVSGGSVNLNTSRSNVY